MLTMREYFKISDRVLINFSIKLKVAKCFMLLKPVAHSAAPQKHKPDRRLLASSVNA